METNHSLAVFRIRSTRAAIADGYRLFTNAFRRLFRATWPVATVYALAMALLSSYAIDKLIPLIGASQILDPEAAHAELTGRLTTFALLALLFVVCTMLLAAGGVSALREHVKTGDITKPAHWWGRIDWTALKHVLVVGVCLVVMAIVIAAALSALFALAAKTGLVMAWVGCAVVSLGFLVLLIPLCYTAFRAVLADKPSLPFGGYLSGLGHVGTLFVTLLLTGIVTLLLTLVTQLPAVILYAANIHSQMGMLGGDEAGMPGNMSWLNFLVFAIAGFIQAYVLLSTFFPFYFAYGSITQQEKERREARLAQQG